MHTNGANRSELAETDRGSTVSFSPVKYQNGWKKSGPDGDPGYCPYGIGA
jgi:hypothetical protein